MHLLPNLVVIGCLVAGLSAYAQTKDVPTYVTSKEIAAMTACTGTLTKRVSAYSGTFTTAEGKQFSLGSPSGEQWAWHFLGTLKEGQSCKLPEAYLNYTSAPNYGTAKEIAALTPCTATLVQQSPCSGYFTTADGKGFSIGNPGSGAQISQFLWSLKAGEPCKFPDVFLQYQKQAKPPDD